MHDPVELIVVFDDNLDEEIIIDPEIALKICNMAVERWESPASVLIEILENSLKDLS